MEACEVTWLALMPSNGKVKEMLVLKQILAFVSTHKPCTVTLDYIVDGKKRLMGTFDTTVDCGELVLKLNADKQCYKLTQRGNKLYIIQL